MKLIKGIPELQEKPLVFSKEKFTEDRAHGLLNVVIEKAREVISIVIDAKGGDWSKNSSTKIRAVFGHWLANATRHMMATITLCDEHDLSVVADVHHRQIFELFLQTRFYASLDDVSKEKYADKIFAIGCIEYLEKLEILKDNEDVKGGYDEILNMLNQVDPGLLEEIRGERKARSFNWFGASFSHLAEKMSRGKENLKGAYQIVSAEIHGAWDLALGVQNPKPGHLDFRGYPDLATMYTRAADLLYQVINLYANLWNEIAESIGAESIYFTIESKE